MNSFNLIGKNNEYINQFHIFSFKILRTFWCLHFPLLLIYVYAHFFQQMFSAGLLYACNGYRDRNLECSNEETRRIPCSHVT